MEAYLQLHHSHELAKNAARGGNRAALRSADGVRHVGLESERDLDSAKGIHVGVLLVGPHVLPELVQQVVTLTRPSEIRYV